MSYLTKNTDRMDIHIEANRGTILIKQKWQYIWLKDSKATDWNYIEKKMFHKKIDDLIWNNWGKIFFLKVSGTSDFAKKYKRIKWDVNFDIEWVLSSHHWKVKVTKYPSTHTGLVISAVSWTSKTIKLDTLDTRKRLNTFEGANYYQYPVAHEFGHAVGNSIYANTGMHGDEYKSSSAYLSDRKSIMNAGMELRDRHLDFIISQLNTMMINTTFSKY